MTALRIDALGRMIWMATIMVFAGIALATFVGQMGQDVSASSQVTDEASIEGVVSDASGAPIEGALVFDGSDLAISDANGVFVLERGADSTDGRIQVSASGYREWSGELTATVSPMSIVLELRPIRALYLNPTVTTSGEQVDRLIEIINTTNANAVVIDIKEEWVWYDSTVSFFRDAGTVRPVFDLPSLLAKFQDNNIYTIARLVVFKDSTVAEVHPDLAITDVTTGGPWRDINGVAWVNPMVQELWEPNVDLAAEAAGHGFDEIQYDYVRFPTDGDLTTMDFGAEYTQEGRENAIQGFLALSRERLLPTGARQSADVFGFTMVVPDDIGIGQNFANLAGYVDYLSPMVYPSHYSDGQFGLPGHPNDFPYEIVDISLRAGIEDRGVNPLQIRPWLQDFDLYGMTPYGSSQVRAQIQAANEHGTSGWMLWDPENRFHLENLDVEEPSSVPNPENTG
jgi:hypothetical protein